MKSRPKKKQEYGKIGVSNILKGFDFKSFDFKKNLNFRKFKNNFKIDFQRLKEPIIISFLVIFSALYFLQYYKGPTAFGDDLAYTDTAYTIYKGHFKESEFIFSHRFLINFPIAFFYYLFGPSDFSSSLWSLLCAVATVVIAYLIGKELYDEKAGLISAVLFTTFPLVTLLATATGDNIPMEFFAALSVLLLLYARKESVKVKKYFKYFLSGFFLYSGLLTTPEFAVVFFFFGCYAVLSYALNKKTGINASSLFFVLGVVLGFSIVAIYEYITLKDPLFFIHSQMRFYSTVGVKNEGGYVGIPSATQDPNFYISVMFPYSFDLSSFGRHFLNSLITNLNSSSNYAGFYFYFFVISAAFLIFLKERRSYLMILWAVSTIGYLQFGTMSITQYILMHRLERFLLIAAVPICVTIGIFVSKILEFRSIVKYAFAALILFLLIYPTFKINYHWYKANYYVKLDSYAIAELLNKIGNATVYAPSGEIGFLKILTNYNQNITYFGLEALKNCSSIDTNFKNIYIVASESMYSVPEDSPGRSWAYGDLSKKCGYQLVLKSTAYSEASLHNEVGLFNPAFAFNVYKFNSTNTTK